MFELPSRKLAMLRAMFLLTALSLSLVPCRELLAQQVVVRVGQPVRVAWIEARRQHRVVGTVLEVPNNDSLVVKAAADVWRFALAGRRVEVRVPRSRQRGALRGAGIGALIGFAAGLAAGGLSILRCAEGDEFCGLGLIFFPPVGVIAGIPVGAIVGGVHPGQRWHRVR
jgi:hypothetical protein